jgi:putative alpha-1,2-mannosidase
LYPAKKQERSYNGNDYAGGTTSPATPAVVPGTSVPTGDAQSSGRTIHNRPGGMNKAGKGENLEGFAQHHQQLAGADYKPTRDTRKV